MDPLIKNKIIDILQSALTAQAPADADVPAIEIEKPAEKEHGDFSSNIALKSAKIFRKSPLLIAEDIVKSITETLEQSDIASSINKIEVKAPGFINFYLSDDAVFKIIEEVFTEKDAFGSSDLGKREKIQIEFVSANPTGPLSVAHARQAAVGDALVNIMCFLGFDAKREYYINDGGNQIRILGLSIKLRALEHLGEAIDFPEDAYQGDYIRDMAKVFMENKGLQSVSDVNAVEDQVYEVFGCDYLLNVIKTELEDFGVKFDVWSHESKVSTKANIETLLADFTNKGLTYENEGALWFKTADFGDDKDRVLRKSDGSFTYLAPDIVYHKNKFERGFNRVYDILGPDHHGYIKRIKAAAQALGKNADDLNVLIVQLASIYRDGVEVSMSTRRGQFISLREVIDEVGVDAARFFFLMRHIKQHLEFDLDLAKKQSSENPVYYVQYAHARVYSINEKAAVAGIEPKQSEFKRLTAAEEIDLIKKIDEFKKSLRRAYDIADPYPVVAYIQELAACFHKFYDAHKVITGDQELSSERLGLVNAARIVLANGLKLLGLSQPRKM